MHTGFKNNYCNYFSVPNQRYEKKEEVRVSHQAQMAEMLAISGSEVKDDGLWENQLQPESFY